MSVPVLLPFFCCSVAKSCLTLCDPMDCNTPDLPVLRHLLELKLMSIQLVIHHLAIQPSHPLSPPSQSSPESGSFPGSQLFPLGGWSIGASVSASVLLMNVQSWFPLGLIDTFKRNYYFARASSVEVELWQQQGLSSSLAWLMWLLLLWSVADGATSIAGWCF